MKLKELRIRMGLSPNAFARKAHLEVSALEAYESGERLPTWDAAQRLGPVFQINPEGIEELKAAIEAPGKEGDPCYCGCAGVKCLPQNPRNGKFSTSRACGWCGNKWIYPPRYGHAHTQYCFVCTVGIRVIERLEASDNSVARLLGAALRRAHMFLAEACAEAHVKEYTVHGWTAPGFAFQIHSPEAERLAKVLDAPELLTALGFDQLTVTWVKVICLNFDSNPKCRGDRWWRSDSIRLGLVYGNPIKTLKLVDGDPTTAEMLCKSCASRKNAQAMVKKIKREGFWVDPDGNVLPGKRKGATWLRFDDALKKNAELNFARVTEEQRDQWRATAHVNNKDRTLKDSKQPKHIRQLLRTSLGHMIPNPVGTCAPCLGCGLLCYSSDPKEDGAPSFHWPCYVASLSEAADWTEWPPPQPANLPTHEFLADSLAMAIQYAQFLQALPSYKRKQNKKGKSAHQMAAENKEAGKEPSTVNGVLHRIDSFMASLPTDGGGGERLDRLSKVLRWALAGREKNWSKAGRVEAEISEPHANPNYQKRSAAEAAYLYILRYGPLRLSQLQVLTEKPRGTLTRALTLPRTVRIFQKLSPGKETDPVWGLYEPEKT